MFPVLWNVLKMPYYEFVVLKEPELTVQWREFHRESEPTKLPGVYASMKDPHSAFHVLKSHIPYKDGVRSIVYFGSKNGINRTGPHQYYPLEDYDTLIAIQHPEESYFVPELDEEGMQKIDKSTGEPVGETFAPIRYVTLTSSWLKDQLESLADHKVQAEPPPGGLAMLLPYIPYIIVAFLLVYGISVWSGHPILGK